jgi:hypothetical protein
MVGTVKVELIVPVKALGPIHEFMGWLHASRTGRLTFHFHRGTVGVIETEAEGVRKRIARHVLDRT